MSSKIYKGGGSIAVPGDEVIVLQVQVSQSGNIKLSSPLSPNEVIKILNNLATDVMFNAVQQMNKPLVEPVSLVVV